MSVLGLANQLSTWNVCCSDESCEHNFCPEIVNKIDNHNTLITGIVCAAVCKQYVNLVFFHGYVFGGQKLSV